MSGAPTSRAASASLMLMSWPLSAFVAGVKIGSGSRSDSRSPFGSCHAADAPGLLVLLPPRSREVAARHAFDRHGLGAAHQHRPAFEDRGVAAERLRETRDVGRKQMMPHEIAHALEPERGQLREDLALVGDPRSEDIVERRDAVGRDDEQVVADLVDVAHFAATVQRQTSQGGFEEWSSGQHRGTLQQKV